MNLRKLSLPLGLLCGVLAGVMVLSFLGEQEKRISGPPPPKVNVMVAKTDVPSGVKLTQEMLISQSILAEMKHPQALESMSEATGKLTLYPLVKGEQVLSPRLGDKPRAISLAGVVPAGRRAVSVAATDVVAAGGLILPGDWVDVLAVFESRDGANVNALATLSLENIEVLALDREAVGVEAKESASQAADAKKPAPAPAGGAIAHTITLAVTPEEAQRLMLADRSGTLRLALRASGDSGMATTTEIDTRTMGKLQSTGR